MRISGSNSELMLNLITKTFWIWSYNSTVTFSKFHPHSKSLIWQLKEQISVFGLSQVYSWSHIIFHSKIFPNIRNDKYYLNISILHEERLLHRWWYNPNDCTVTVEQVISCSDEFQICHFTLCVGPWANCQNPLSSEVITSQ